MSDFYYKKADLLRLLLISLIISFNVLSIQAQSFSQSTLDFDGKGSISNGTSLMFGPDSRLYVAEYTGEIKILTVEREVTGNYKVLELETLTGIKSIQDHNDDGTKYSSTLRETTGLTVAGTAANPIIYVASSDFRIGGGGGGGSGDIGLDTNSGIITRFTWIGGTWEVVDLVRGLPRSEENHATNGMEFVTVNGIDYLIVAQGGHTNAGSPSTNFAYTTEYALSAAILSVNLTMLNAMPVLTDNGRKYVYNLPTLDDPTRANKNGITNPDIIGYDGIDVNDPFGGNDGLNQAKIVVGGPVQIFSPGYRNAYDLVVTETGAVYVTDNGANGGWGGFPVNEGTEDCNNDYDPSEPGSTSPIGGEQINNKDHLSLITQNIQNYSFGSFYGGHPNPVRANPYGAGLYTNPSTTGTTGAVFRTDIYHPTKSTSGFTTNPNLGLPANWPPVSQANSMEGDYRIPGKSNPDGPDDEFITIWGTNTNGIDEYTSSNFGGLMKGNLIAGVNTGVLRRVELNADGSLKNLTSSFVSGLGGDALGITCNSDLDPFPGTIWVVTLNGILVVLEPQDFGNCLSPDDPNYNAAADYDLDGYTNKDEVDNQTDICNGGSQPENFDKASEIILISDLNDSDDDNDGLLDENDPFQLGDHSVGGSDAFNLPVINQLFSSNPDLKGYKGLGLTGLMNNGDSEANWLNWLDRRDDINDPNPNDILGGAIGAMTMQMTSGTAENSENSQEKAFQYGVQVDQSTGVFTVSGGLYNFYAPLQLYGNSSAPEGELGIFIGDGSQSNFIKFVITPSGLIGQAEVNDNTLPPISLNINTEDRPDTAVTFYFVVSPISGNISLEYEFDSGTREILGSILAEGALLTAIQQSNIDLAVGLIGSSNALGVEVEGTWDFLNVFSDNPVITQILPDLDRVVGAASDNISLSEYFFDDGGVENLIYTVVENSDPSIEANIVGEQLNLQYPSFSVVSNLTIRATDADLNFVEQRFQVSLQKESIVLYRVNSGGPTITSIDGDIDWSGDTRSQKSAYLSQAGNNNTYSGTINSYTAAVDQSTTPITIFNSERYDATTGPPNITYSFPITEAGTYEVRLYLGNSYSGTSEPGNRVYDISIEGVVYPDLKDLDLSGTFGHQIGGVLTHNVEVSDGLLEISFLHGAAENPLINGIEILGASSVVGTPILIASIPNQTNTIGDELDGSFVASASGGDGALMYSMTGAPLGISIEPTNGQIGGAIDASANLGSPYTVNVSVDDSDGLTTDAVSTSFTWAIISEKPVVTQILPDLDRLVGTTSDNISLSEYFFDDGGVENLVYTIEENSDPSIEAEIVGELLTLQYPLFSVVSNLTIRATDADLNFVEQRFQVSLRKESLVLYRVNSGGPTITSIDGDIDWSGDTRSQKSAYLSQAGSNNTYSGTISSFTAAVDQSTTPVSIFNSERFDASKGPPNITYSFPITEAGTYEVRLYLGNSYSGTSKPGNRVYDVSIEGVVYPELKNLDLSGTFGHQIGGVLTHNVEVTDGLLEISFLHGAAENPLINGIEILGVSLEIGTPISLASIPNQTNTIGEELSGNLVATANGGDGVLSYSLSGAPAGVIIDPSTGVLSGTIASDADAGSPYSVTITVDDNDSQTDDAVSTSFSWIITAKFEIVWTDKNENENYTARHECSFVQAGDKFYLMGGREMGKKIDIYDYTSNTWASLPNSAPFEFNHFQATEYQGLIWVIGAFKDNLYPTEAPAEYIWAFDPATQEWIQGPEIPLDRRRGSTGLVVNNDKFYIIAGNTNGHDGGYVSWFDEYDPATGLWRILSDAPRPRDHFHSAVIGNKLYAVGGRLSGGTGGTFRPVIPEIDVYNFTTETWETLPAEENLPTPRAAPSVVNWNDKLIVIGGEVEQELIDGTLTSDALKITEEYDPATKLWTRLADLNYERHGTQAIVSGSGIFTLAGSPNLGGGAQKNMEYFGEDNPLGSTSISSTITFPSEVLVSNNITSDIDFELTGGNIGVMINSIIVSGYNAENFILLNENTSMIFVKPNSALPISIDFLGSLSNETASLTINYGGGEAVILLTSDVGDKPIQITPFGDQTNTNGDQLDGSLMASASGGDGELSYSLSGAPAGVSIDASTGVLSGTIASGADVGSPYSVTITVDDDDSHTDDAVSTVFSWIIITGTPTITQVLPDLDRFVGAASDNISLSEYFFDNGGIENLVYTVVENSDPSIEANIVGEQLNLQYPSFSVVSNLTIRATDADLKFVEQGFQVRLRDESIVLYRINAGGPAVTSIDGDIDWSGDTRSQKSVYLSQAGNNNTYSGTINSYTAAVDRSTTPISIFNSERFDASKGPPNITYSFPVSEAGTYEVRLYLGNSWSGTSKPGNRVYDVSIEGVVYPDLKDLDLSGTFGHQIGGVLTHNVEVTDGLLEISFLHGAAENPLINGIEIIGASSAGTIKTGAASTKFLDKSITEENIDFGARIYPNPVSSQAYIKISDGNVKLNEIHLYGYSGQLIKTFNAEKSKVYSDLYMIDVLGLSDGIYIVKLDALEYSITNLRLVVKK